jgi:uncharacterized protein YdcH (DUF465 family)
MNERDLALIERLIPDHPELTSLLAMHREYEARLEVISRQKWRTPQEEYEAKRLKQLKLAGRDRMESILAVHRRKAATA